MQDILDSLSRTIGVEDLAHESFAVDVAPTVTASRFRVDEAATAALMANALLIRRIWAAQTGHAQQLRIDTRQAALSLLSFMLQTQNGYPIGYPDCHLRWPYYPIMAPYPARDGRQVYLAGVYPHLRDGLLSFLDCANNAKAIGAALRRHDAELLERELNAQQLTAAIVRSPAEWRAHPQGRLLLNSPPVRITRLAHGRPRGLEGGPQPLSGLRVLDLTHVLAGPTATRGLAEQGADVLRISDPLGFDLFPFVVDTGHGKRNAFLDLRQDADRDRLWSLIGSADVFVQGYAPGKVAALGFDPSRVAAASDGLVYCTLSAYGTEGPCGTWGGFEQLAQAASGLMAAHSSADRPELVPAAVADYLTGYLASLGILAALLRRARDGGSYHVELSLVRTAMWVLELGERADADEPGVFPLEELASFQMASEGPLGTIRHLRPAVEYERTKPHFPFPASVLGSTRAAWSQPV